MSFQAYLDNIESRTGKTPEQLVAIAAERGFAGPDTKAGPVVEWLKTDYGLGRGHAMAIVHVIKHGAAISAKHVGTTGSHRDESDVLRLSGRSTASARSGSQAVDPATRLDDPALRLPRPMVRALAGAGLMSLGDALARPDADLLALHGVGPKGIRMLRALAS